MLTINRLATELLPHAMRMATSKKLWRYTRRYRDYDDALSCINDAVCKAVRTYEPTRGTKWTTWLLHNLFLQLRAGLRKRRRLPMDSNEGLARVPDVRPDYSEEDLATMEANAQERYKQPAWVIREYLAWEPEAKVKAVPVVARGMF